MQAIIGPHHKIIALSLASSLSHSHASAPAVGVVYLTYLFVSFLYKPLDCCSYNIHDWLIASYSHLNNQSKQLFYKLHPTFWDVTILTVPVIGLKNDTSFFWTNGQVVLIGYNRFVSFPFAKCIRQINVMSLILLC